MLAKEKIFGTGKNAFDIEKLFNICELDVSNESWAKIFGSCLDDSIFKKAEQFILEAYKGYDFIIGFELPDIFIEVFNKNQIPYIDGFLHPIRFYNDLIICFRTNVPRINRILPGKEYFFSRNNIYNNTNFERAKLYITRGLGLQDNSCLFLGQTNVDKSIIKDGKIFSIFDFKERFENLGNAYEKVYYKIHPFMAQNEELVNYLNSLDFVEIVDQAQEKYSDYNMYRMIMQKSIKKTYSITSSGCYEADFIGKDSEWFLEYPFKIVENSQEARTISAYESSEFIPVKPKMIFNQQFWLDILEKNANDVIDKDLEVGYVPGQIRNSSGMKWGYKFFE